MASWNKENTLLKATKLTKDMKNSKFIVFVDHQEGFRKFDRYVTLEGDTLLEAMKDFQKKFSPWTLRNSVSLYRMMQKKGRKPNGYEGILVNRGTGWNYENDPVEETIPQGRIYNSNEIENL